MSVLLTGARTLGEGRQSASRQRCIVCDASLWTLGSRQATSGLETICSVAQIGVTRSSSSFGFGHHLRWTFYAIDHFNWDFAAMILLGFFALLRTGECLQVAARDLLIGENSAVVSLSNTKTSLRHAAKKWLALKIHSFGNFARGMSPEKASPVGSSSHLDKVGPGFPKWLCSPLSEVWSPST